MVRTPSHCQTECNCTRFRKPEARSGEERRNGILPYAKEPLAAQKWCVATPELHTHRRRLRQPSFCRGRHYMQARFRVRMEYFYLDEPE